MYWHLLVEVSVAPTIRKTSGYRSFHHLRTQVGAVADLRYLATAVDPQIAERRPDGSIVIPKTYMADEKLEHAKLGVAHAEVHWSLIIPNEVQIEGLDA